MTVTEPTMSYEETLRTLSEASVDHHFDAFKDIPWDDPDFAVLPDDPRWALGSAHPLGRTEWYQSLSPARQREIGRYAQANIAKVGLQFEQVLISGIMVHLLSMPNNRPEFRYSTHEATEECHHTQMFQELVNRIGLDVKGGPTWFRKVAPLIPLAAGPFPFIFFIGVLAGEEPIDYLQKTILRSEHAMHPMVTRVMQIHVAEEARHISFAHQYLRQRALNLKPHQRAILSVATPVLMRVLCDVIMKPSRKMQRDLGIPKHVVKEVWWDSPESAKMLRDTFRDVRGLAEELGFMNRTSTMVWRWLKIDGGSSRFRSEPASAAS